MTKANLRKTVWVVAPVAMAAIAVAAVAASSLANSSTRPAPLAGGTPTGTVTGTPTRTATAAPTTNRVPSDVASALTPGTVTIHCEGAVATLVSFTPNPGWRSDDPVRGPAAQVSVRFESDVAADYLVSATCVDSEALVSLGPDVDDHGGDDGSRGHGSDDVGYDDHGGDRGGHGSDDDGPDDHGGHGSDDDGDDDHDGHGGDDKDGSGGTGRG